MNNLTVEHISKAFINEKKELLATLENVCFAVPAGARIALLGKSGCGKTTLLNIIAGFDQADTGTVSYTDSPTISAQKHPAVVFQTPALFSWMNVLQNVTYGLKRQRQKKADRETAALQMIEKVGLKGFEKYYPYELSGGMQQRVALARVFVMKPQLLLMDEPFAALDALLRDQMQRLLLSLWEDYQPTILFVTHDVEEAVRIADRILFLEGQPAQIQQSIPIPLTFAEQTASDTQMKILQLKETLKNHLFPPNKT